MTNNPPNTSLEEIAALVRRADIGPDASRLVVRIARLVGRGRPVTDDEVTGVIGGLRPPWFSYG